MMNMLETIRQEKEIWDLFTRKEEDESTIRDRHGRFPYYASKHRHIFEPLASKHLVEHGFTFEYPENRPFAVCLTHDIDVLYKPIVKKGATVVGHLRHARLSDCRASLREMRSRREPWWNFSEIMAIEEKHGARSSFFFMVQDPGDHDFAYRIEDCKEVMEVMDQDGWEIGLHGGYDAYNDPAGMKRKKARLENVLGKGVDGYRNHFLRLQIPESWEYLADAGFTYDTTLGYSDCIGFRNGMCHPFRPYNARTGGQIDLLEIPLTVMDTTLFARMQLTPQGAWDLTRRLIDTVHRYRGVLTVLWHNTYFSGHMGNFYEKILDYCGEKNAWMTTGGSIEKWVREGNCPGS